MMKPKILLLFLSRRDQNGFAIALVLLMGLVMVLVGITLMVRSTKQKTYAEAHQVIAEGISMAEVGITRFQDLLNRNRYAALYDDCQSRNASTNVCEDSGTTTKTWANASNISELENIVACSSSSIIDIETFAHQGEWINVDRDSDQRQYRLISYRFQKADPTQEDNTAPGTGILTLEGRVKQDNQLKVATARLVVEIPIKENEPDSEAIPGVWLTNGGVDKNEIKGDVLLNDCDVSLSTINITPDTGYSAKHTLMEFPDLPELSTVLSYSTTNYLEELQPADFNGSPTYRFPRTGDIPRLIEIKDEDDTVIKTIEVYEYVIDNIHTGGSGNFNSGDKIEIEPGKRVTLYLEGNISKGIEFKHSCGTITDCQPTNFQIYGYAPSEDNPQICLNGSDKIEALIFAPNYQVGVSGSGVGGEGGGVKGSVWANTWSTHSGCGSNTSNIVVEQTARWEDLYKESGFVPQNIPPRLSSISNWKRLER